MGEHSRYSNFKLWSGRTGVRIVRIPAGLRDFSLLQNIQTGSETHPASSSTGTEFHFWR